MKAKNVETTAAFNLAEVAGQARRAAAEAGGKLREMTGKGAYQLEKTAQNASDVAKEISTMALYAAQELVQTVSNKARDIANIAHHRDEHLATQAGEASSAAAEEG